jgi:hypothetical protein
MRRFAAALAVGVRRPSNSPPGRLRYWINTLLTKRFTHLARVVLLRS